MSPYYLNDKKRFQFVAVKSSRFCEKKGCSGGRQRVDSREVQHCQ